MSPIFLGLILSVPLVRWTSLQSFGLRSQAAGLLLVPTETAPSDEIIFVRAAKDALSVEHDSTETEANGHYVRCAYTTTPR